MTKAAPRIIILGALSAVAEATARLYAREGARLMLVARDSGRLGAVAADLRIRGAAEVLTATMDLGTVSPAEQLPKLAEALGGADHVLLAYGTLGDQAGAEKDETQARALLDVNFTSAALWSLAAAAHLEAQEAGVLVVIGSVAGDRGRQSNYVYGAAKGGLGILVQGIAHRLAPSGARAVLIKPGFIDTPMTAHIAKGGPLWAKPETIAQIIRKAADNAGPIVYAPGIWRLILMIIRLVPAMIFHKTKL